MPSPAQTMAREILRDAGPLTIDEMLARVPDWRPPRSKDRKGAPRNAISNDQLLANRGDGHYVFLPVALNGATMRLPVVVAEGEPRRLRVGDEVAVLCWPVDEDRRGQPSVSLVLDGGPTVTLTRRERLRREEEGWEAPTVVVEPEPAFWAWWEAQHCGGADALLLHCEEHAAGRFGVRAIRSTNLNPAAVAASNRRLLDTARTAMKGTAGMLPTELTRRLLARGVYHQVVPPDPLFVVLLGPASPFIVEMGYRIVDRPELTPALRRLFAARIDAECGGTIPDALLGIFGADPPRSGDEAVVADQPLAVLPPPREAPPAAVGYRLKVSLEADPAVWRVVEILDNQTFEDLHYAIQDAFDWDDDHLYVFYLSGRFNDRLTEIGRPTGEDWDDPPLANEILLADAVPRPGQRFAYRFDLAAAIDHVLEVLGDFPAPSDSGTDGFPRVVEAHGEAPPQDEAGDGFRVLFVIQELPR